MALRRSSVKSYFRLWPTNMVRSLNSLLSPRRTTFGVRSPMSCSQKGTKKASPRASANEIPNKVTVRGSLPSVSVSIAHTLETAMRSCSSLNSRQFSTA